MRRVMHGDLTAAARACLAVPPAARAALAARLLEEAHAGHRYHRRFRRPHPRLGDGSLMVRARLERLVDEPPLSEPDYAACLVLVLESLARWRAARVRQPDAQEMQRVTPGSSARRRSAMSSPQSSQ